LLQRLANWKHLTVNQVAELSAVLHHSGDDETLHQVAAMTELYRMRGPENLYNSQADLAMAMLFNSESARMGAGKVAAWVSALEAANFSNPSERQGDWSRVVPDTGVERRLLAEAIGRALKRDPPSEWANFLTQWSEKLQTQAATSES
jgi:hypothetical protein